MLVPWVGRAPAFAHDQPHRPVAIDDFVLRHAIATEMRRELDVEVDQRVLDFFGVVGCQLDADFAAGMRPALGHRANQCRIEALQGLHRLQRVLALGAQLRPPRFTAVERLIGLDFADDFVV